MPWCGLYKPDYSAVHKSLWKSCQRLASSRCSQARTAFATQRVEWMTIETQASGQSVLGSNSVCVNTVVSMMLVTHHLVVMSGCRCEFRPQTPETLFNACDGPHASLHNNCVNNWQLSAIPLRKQRLVRWTGLPFLPPVTAIACHFNYFLHITEIPEFCPLGAS